MRRALRVPNSMTQDVRHRKHIGHETEGWEGDLIHPKISNCVSGRRLLVASCQDLLLSKTVLPLTYRCFHFVAVVLPFCCLQDICSISHQARGWNTWYWSWWICSLTISLLFIPAAFCPQLGTNTCFLSSPGHYFPP